DYTLPKNVDGDEDDDDPDPEFTAATHASRRSYAEEDERRRGLRTSGAHLSRDDSRRSLPRSTSVRRAAGALGCGGRLSDVHAPTQGPMDAYLYRSRSVKQPRIKQALKGVKATAKATKGAIKGYFFNPKIQYKDNVHNDREVMRGTMNVITHLARTMTERLDAMAEVERYMLKLGIYGGYDMTYAAQRLIPGYFTLLGVLEPREVMGLQVSCQDMKIIQNHPINKKEAKGKHNSNMGDMKANKDKQGMIGDMGLLIHHFLVPQNCHIQISALVVGQIIWAIFKLLDMVVSSLRDNQEKVQANKQRHLEASKENSKTLQILCLALDIHSMEDMSMCHLFNLMR
ncbi:hypothetical protein Taro_001081, partial [Colocasia esculenta]|nr:hypothetical protein [Colocasia esculenta]